MTLLVTLTSIYVPLQLAFEDIMDSFDPEYFVLAFFWVDIVLTLRTTYFDEDTDEIIDPVRLIKYLNDNSLKILYKILRYFFAFLLVVLFFSSINANIFLDSLGSLHVVCNGLFYLQERSLH